MDLGGEWIRRGNTILVFEGAREQGRPSVGELEEASLGGEEQEQVPLPTPDAGVPGRTTAIVPANACLVARAGGALQERPGSAITHVVIHTIEANHYATSIENWRKGGGQACFKPHYAVSKAGAITQIVAEKHITAHGNATNAYSVGIEHEGYSRNPDDYTEELYRASAALTRDICQRRGIPMDAGHIIGHDVAPGNCAPGGHCHGDPGGYWDWEYYLSLVNWAGDARARPIRLVVTTASPTFSAGAAWTPVPGRKAGTGGPYPSHSWSANFYRARPDPRADSTQSAWFGAVIPDYGRYDVALWWPVLTGNNPATLVGVDKLGYLPGTLGRTPIAQNSSTGRWRRTVALPHTPIWKPLGTLDCVAGNVIWVQVSRNSARGGQVVADAVRIFRKG
jgi:hypothetical protein